MPKTLRARTKKRKIRTSTTKTRGEIMTDEGINFVLYILLFVLGIALIMYGTVTLINEHTTKEIKELKLVCPETIVNVSISNETNVINHTYNNYETNYRYKVKQESVICDEARLKDMKVKDFMGFSMQPEIYSWYKALSIVYDGEELVEGDIVVFELEGQKVAHSVDAIYFDRIVVCPLMDLRDDGMFSCDVIQREDILSVVCGVIYG